MKLHNIVENTDWESVWNRFSEMYPNYREAENLCNSIYQELKTKSPVYIPTVIFLAVTNTDNINSDRMNVEVLGRMENNELDCAIEFNPIEEWLGMEIDAITLKEYSPSELVAHCIYNMVCEKDVVKHFQTAKNKILQAS